MNSSTDGKRVFYIAGSKGCLVRTSHEGHSCIDMNHRAKPITWAHASSALRMLPAALEMDPTAKIVAERTA